MLGLFLVLQIVSASPALHHWFHEDSDSPDHQCVIRLVSQGQFDHAPVQVTVPLPQIVSVTVVFPDSVALVVVDYRLLPGRAPPFLLT